MSARKECRTCGSDIFPPDCNFELETEAVESCSACPQAFCFDETEWYIELDHQALSHCDDYNRDDDAHEVAQMAFQTGAKWAWMKVRSWMQSKVTHTTEGESTKCAECDRKEQFARVVSAKLFDANQRIAELEDLKIKHMNRIEELGLEACRLEERIAELEQRLQVAELDLADANHQVAELEAELQAYEIGSSFEARRADKLEARLAHCRTRKTINGEDVKMKYTFESVAYDNTKVTVTLEADTLTDVVEAFEQFLRGSGFYFEGRLDLTQEDKKDVEDFV